MSFLDIVNGISDEDESFSFGLSGKPLNATNKNKNYKEIVSEIKADKERLEKSIGDYKANPESLKNVNKKAAAIKEAKKRIEERRKEIKDKTNETNLIIKKSSKEEL